MTQPTASSRDRYGPCIQHVSSISCSGFLDELYGFPLLIFDKPDTTGKPTANRPQTLSKAPTSRYNETPLQPLYPTISPFSRFSGNHTPTVYGREPASYIMPTTGSVHLPVEDHRESSPSIFFGRRTTEARRGRSVAYRLLKGGGQPPLLIVPELVAPAGVYQRRTGFPDR